MTQQDQIFIRRFKEIDRAREELDAEYAMLVGMQSKLGRWPQLLKVKDRFTSRSAQKFEFLALIADYLGKEDPLLYGGAETREIYNAVVEALELAEQRRLQVNSDPERYENGLPLVSGMPLSKKKRAVNYNTFRSYLGRFKEEGRLFYNEQDKKWRITEDEYFVTWQDEHERDDDL